MTTVEDVRAALGGDAPRLSEWVEVTQQRTDQFADATEDRDWMHTDPVRAREAGFGGTIAFGFWTLSMLTRFLHDCMERDVPRGVAFGFNYGLDRVRFLAPVPVGGRIRNRMSVVDVVEKTPGRVLVTTRNEVEIEGREGPAMVADWLVLFVSER